MIAWHRPDMTPEDIQDILRTSRVNNEMADKLMFWVIVQIILKL